MRYECPSEDTADEWFAPLEAVAKRIEGQPRYQFFELADFMIMARGVAPDGTAIYLYKHYFTRHYLNLDADGNAYNYVGGATDDDDVTDHYVPLPDLETGLDALDLWELPWMKEGLESHRRGLNCDERWKLHPDNEHPGDRGGETRGHLRLV